MVRCAVFFVLGFSTLGCATQQATSQAMTIAGAAAVVVGASMAANNRCHDVTPEGGGPGAFCSSGLSRGARNVGTGVAVAGAALAAAGYALQPKGPDRLQGGANALPAPAWPYRLARPAPAVAGPPAAPAEPAAVEQGCPARDVKPASEAAPGDVEEAPAEDASQPNAGPPCAAPPDETAPSAAPELSPPAEPATEPSSVP